MADYTLSVAQNNIRQLIHYVAETEVRPLAIQADKDKGYPPEFLLKLFKMGVHGGSVISEKKEPREGDGPKKERETYRLSAIASEELAWGDPALLLSLSGPGLGGPPVQMMGTPEQKDRFFSKFSDGGLHYGAYATTEPGCGSDVSAIATTAEKDGDYYILNGTKCFITNGGIADWVVIFATVDKSKGRAGHRAFVVEKGTPGFSVGKVEEKLGIRANETVELILDNCRVSVNNLLGGEEYYEKSQKGGFKGAMKTFDATRPIVAAMAIGIARAAYEIGMDFLDTNYGAKTAKPRYRHLKDRMALLGAKLEAARLATWKAVWMADLRISNSKEASVCKILAPQVAEEMTREVVGMMGPYGVIPGSFVEKLYRDQKVYNIFEGTGQIQRVVISRRLASEYS